MSYGEPQVDAPVDHGQSGGVPTSGTKPAGYDEAQKMNGTPYDLHEIGPGWTPLVDSD